MNRVKKLWSTLRSSFWFMPAWIVLGSVAVAVVLIKVDYYGGTQWLNQWPLLFGAGADGARGMMSTIAGSMMTVVGVTFSMILVVLTLASSQYTSRILRNFTRNRVTQAVLGIFAGIFTYCLIVLRTIRSGDEGAFVPSLAVFFGFVLALVGVGALMFFIQHIASSIEASGIIASVARETIAAVDRLFPEKLGQGPDESEDDRAQHPLADRNWIAVPAKESGYIQSVNNAAILRLRGTTRPLCGWSTASASSLSRAPSWLPLRWKTRRMSRRLPTCSRLSASTTPHGGTRRGIRYPTDRGCRLKALSPGINDTTTAVMCVDYLASVLARVAPRPIPSSHRFEDGELRVIAKGPSFESLLAESFDQIRRSAKGDVVIMSRMLDALQLLASLTARPSRRRVLREQVQRIAELAERTIDSAHDRAAIDRHVTRVFETFEAKLDRRGGE
jgi:uncharacterized membrane protein